MFDGKISHYSVSRYLNDSYLDSHGVAAVGGFGAAVRECRGVGTCPRRYYRRQDMSRPKIVSCILLYAGCISI